jgi:ABC-type Fe3+ transport system permease subunit
MSWPTVVLMFATACLSVALGIIIPIVVEYRDRRRR